MGAGGVEAGAAGSDAAAVISGPDTAADISGSGASGGPGAGSVAGSSGSGGGGSTGSGSGGGSCGSPSAVMRFSSISSSEGGVSSGDSCMGGFSTGGSCTGGSTDGSFTDSGRIMSGSAPSMNSGASERPQPRERSPPKPVSASSRKAAFTGSVHARGPLRRGKRRPSTSPRPARNSMHAVECRSVAPVSRSTAAFQRTPVRNGPRTPGGHQALAGAIHAPLVLVQRLPRQNRLHDPQRNEARALPAHARRHAMPARWAARWCAAEPRSRSRRGTESRS